jgi:hypothetical protein
VSESVVRAKRGLGFGLARNRRGPKRPSEPRLRGVHPAEGAVGEKQIRHQEVIARSRFSIELATPWFI